MGLLVDRQFKQCYVCGGKIQIDTVEYPGEGAEDAKPVHETVEAHLGSCTPLPSGEVVPEEPHPGYGTPAVKS